MTAQPEQEIFLERVPILIRIGAFPEEMHAPQPVLVSVRMRAVPEVAARVPEALEDCIDYHRVWLHLTRDWPQRPHLPLVEQWAAGLLEFLLEDPKIAWAEVRIEKTAIYGQGAGAGVVLSRAR